MKASLLDAASAADREHIMNSEGVLSTWIVWLQQMLIELTENRIDELNMFGTLLLLGLLVCGWLYTSFTKHQPRVCRYF